MLMLFLLVFLQPWHQCTYSQRPMHILQKMYQKLSLIRVLSSFSGIFHISYTFILTIEKIIFNAHDLLEVHAHEHQQEKHHDDCKHEKDKQKEKIDQDQDYLKNYANEIQLKANSEIIDGKTQVMNKSIDSEQHCISGYFVQLEIINYSNTSSEENQNNENQQNISNSLNSQFIEKQQKQKINRKNNLNTSCIFVSQHKSLVFKGPISNLKNKKNLQNIDELVLKSMINPKQQFVRIMTQVKQMKKLQQLKNRNQFQQINNQASIIQENEKSNDGTSIIQFVLLFALSFHGFFEGIAIGLANRVDQLGGRSKSSQMGRGSDLRGNFSQKQGKIFTKTSKKQSMIMIIFFSFVTPIGIMLGTIMNHNPLLVAIFYSISAGIYFSLGTFIYISSTEIIVEEFSISKNKWTKLLMYLSSFAFMSVLKLFEH